MVTLEDIKSARENTAGFVHLWWPADHSRSGYHRVRDFGGPSRCWYGNSPCI